MEQEEEIKTKEMKQKRIRRGAGRAAMAAKYRPARGRVRLLDRTAGSAQRFAGASAVSQAGRLVHCDIGLKRRGQTRLTLVLPLGYHLPGDAEMP